MTADAPLLPLDARIRLAHAVVQAVADDAGIEVLHIKGYAVDPGLYREGRRSTDVDVLARPDDAEPLLEALARNGWRVRTSFRTGSPFEHAAVARHDDWGWVDVHRRMPGLGIAPDLAFDRLRASGKTVAIAGVPCRVPGADHQALLIMVHDARTPGRINADARHLLHVLDEAALARVEAAAGELDAGLALAAATGRLDEHRDHPDHPLWAAIRAGGDR
ncbi:MAG: nucleotidyltransferase family protein, partial [Microbacteriaceae bacterium]|nr:nucleotidyltransferase family protein [Microbacteriaceae bacterium]